MRQRAVVVLVALVAASAIVLGAAYVRTDRDTAVRAVQASASPTILASGPAQYKSGGWKLVFDPSFGGKTLNTSMWATCSPGASAGCTNFGNKEYEWYLPSQVLVYGGALHLLAQRIPTTGLDQNGAPKEYSCRSGMIATSSSFNFQYGYMEIVAHIPSGAGLWQALWLVAVSQSPAEIDILEHWGNQSNSGVYLHPAQGARQGGRIDTPNISSGWHTFGLYWSRSSLIWYIDGKKVFSASQDIPHQPMYFIANLADDALPHEGGCSGTMLIRSIKVWKPSR